MRKSVIARWIMSLLNTLMPMTKAEMLEVTGCSKPGLNSALRRLEIAGEVVKFCEVSPDHGTTPALFMRRFDDFGRRVPDGVLRERAQPRIDDEWSRFVRRRNEYTASQIRGRKDREAARAAG